MAAVQSRERAAKRAQDIEAVMQMEQHLVTAHLAAFPSPPPPGIVTAASLLPGLRRDALSGLHWWQRRKRQTASKSSRAEAEHRAQEETKAWADHYARIQHNDPNTVLAALEDVFADNEHPTAPIDCTGAVATILIVVDPATAVPDRIPAVTPGGRPTLRKRTETERQQLYARAMASTVLATVKEAYSTCQWLQDIKILAIRKDLGASTPQEFLVAIYAGHFPVSRVAALDWRAVDPLEELLVAPGALMVRSGPAKRISPLRLDDQPELRAVLEHLRANL